MKHLKIFESFSSDYQDDIDKSRVEITKKYEQNIRNYLYDLHDEFPLELKIRDRQSFGASIFSFSCDFKSHQFELFKECFDQSLFDRIKQDFPDTYVYFQIEFVSYRNGEPTGSMYYDRYKATEQGYLTTKQVINAIPLGIKEFKKNFRITDQEDWGISVTINIR